LFCFDSFFLYLGYHDYTQTTKSQTQQSYYQISALTEVIALQINSIRHTLIDIRNSLPEGWQKNKGVLEETHRKIGDLAKSSVNFFGISILDKSGTVIISNQSKLVGQNFVTRNYFKVPRDNPNSDLLYISPPFNSIFGTWPVVLTLVIFDNNNTFNGVVTAILNQDTLDAIFKSFQYQSNMHIYLANGCGNILLTYPEKNTLKNNKTTINYILRSHIGKGTDLAIPQGTDDETGERQIFTLKTIRKSILHTDSDLILAIERTTKSVYASFRHDISIYTTICFLTTILSTTLLIAYQIRRQRFINETSNSKNKSKQLAEDLENFFEISPDLLCIINTNGLFISANSAWKSILCYSKEEIVGHEFINFVHKDDVNITIDAIIELQKKQTTISFTNRYKHKGGEYKYLEWRSILRGDLIYSSARDITEKKISEISMANMAYKDPLTGLSNRAALFQKLSQAIEETRQLHKLLGILCIDLDGFKKINDTFGHKAGDTVLITTSTRLLSILRSTDLVTRTGGDEFVVILCNLNESKDAGLISTKIIKKISEDIKIQGQTIVSVGASVGISVYPENGETIDELLLAADNAMYSSKRNGKNQFSFSTSSPTKNDSAKHSTIGNIPILGFDQIDMQHKKIAQHIVDIQNSIQENSPQEIIEKKLDMLTESSIENFSNEESYMQTYKYHDYVSHKKSHEVILNELDAIKSQINLSGRSFILATFDRWLCNHILSDDRNLIVFLKEKCII